MGIGCFDCRSSLVAGAGAALASASNIFEDGLQIGWVFFVFILGTAIFDLALLALTVVIARTGRGGHRLLALIPAATVAAIIFYVWAGGAIMLVTWLATAAVSLAYGTPEDLAKEDPSDDQLTTEGSRKARPVCLLEPRAPG